LLNLLGLCLQAVPFVKGVHMNIGRAGIAFPHLFRLCRERFLVGNELGLRAHLTEFRDHELLQTRCEAQAARYLVSTCGQWQ